jgi:EAL domain-containing protein (putative c-di-GMP-specific phosphodiesterase class I)
VTPSVGIAVGGAGQRAESLLRDADVAMYRAKSGGKARHVIFEDSMQIDALSKLEMENDLRLAVERGELRVNYQPIVLFDTGRIAEAEALVHWNHPTRGLIFPVDFIAIAEDTGLIIPIGQWVLTEACRQAAVWQVEFPANPPLTISVNLSPRQFQQAMLLESVKSALSESGLEPSSLKLEITEGVIMRDIETTIGVLRELKTLGVQIAVDDFGTGYSSLSYLKRLPLDVIKIDRSFVTGIGNNPEDTAIVQAIISMAKSLNLSVTGEGVETTEQSDLLRTWGCDRGQGYLFARPLDAKDLAEFLRAATPGGHRTAVA